MRCFTPEEISEILQKHALWLRYETGGKRANFGWANLTGANLTGANLTRAYFYDADLTGADLTDANLTGADLGGADLTLANLTRANLTRANLTDVSLGGAELPDFQIPQNVELTVYKKLRDNVVAELLIPAYASRTATPVDNKCRASEAKVIALHGTTSTEVSSLRDEGFIYKLGATVKPNDYNPDIRVACTNGIHFFMRREEAEAYDT